MECDSGHRWPTDHSYKSRGNEMCGNGRGRSDCWGEGRTPSHLEICAERRGIWVLLPHHGAHEHVHSDHALLRQIQIPGSKPIPALVETSIACAIKAWRDASPHSSFCWNPWWMIWRSHGWWVNNAFDLNFHFPRPQHVQHRQPLSILRCVVANCPRCSISTKRLMYVQFWYSYGYLGLLSIHLQSGERPQRHFIDIILNQRHHGILCIKTRFRNQKFVIRISHQYNMWQLQQSMAL